MTKAKGKPSKRRPTSRPDPLIDEVRALRRKLSAEYGNDIDKLCDHLKEVESRYKARLVRSKSRRSTA